MSKVKERYISYLDKLFYYGLALVMELVSMVPFMTIVVLNLLQFELLLIVIYAVAVGLSYVIYAVSQYIESKIILKHRIESTLIAVMVISPIYFVSTYILITQLMPLVPAFLDVFEFLILLLLIPTVTLLVMIYILSS